MLAAGILAAVMLAAATCCRQAQAADPMPLFLAARQTDDDLSPQMRRAAQLRLDQRAAAVANANLKWKPYRPQVASTTPESPSQAAADSQPQSVKQVSATEAQATAEPKALQASQIATSDGELRFRRVIPRPSRGKLRDEILRVSSDNVDPFAEMPEPSQIEPPAADEPEPPRKIPARRPPGDSGEPKPFSPAEDPFPNENLDNSLPPPEGTNPDRYRNEPPFASADATPSASCEQDKRECEAALIKLRNTTLDKLDIDIAITGHEGDTFPCECPLTGEFEGRNWASSTFTWKASLACHEPLYFEEVALERYGHSLNPIIGPLWSGVHFFLTIPVLPYKMSLEPINECQYALGYYRPGNCAPYLVPPIPLSIEAGLIETGAIFGGFWILR